MRTYDSKDLTDPVRDTADKIARKLYDLSNAADRYLQRTGLDRIFFHNIWLTKDSPLLHVADTQEIQQPFRTSSSLIVKRPRATKGVAIGIWSEHGTSEEEGLLRAVTGQEPEQEDIDQFDTDATLRERAVVVEGAHFPGTNHYRDARSRTPSPFEEELRDRERAADNSGSLDDVDPDDPEWTIDAEPIR
jgi:hypothetical protein